MNINIINPSYLNNSNKQKEETKIIIYNKIYEKIEKRIIAVNNSNATFLIYEVPCFLIGYPTFNVDTCSTYIQNKLISNNFKVNILSKNTLLLISWAEDNI